MKKILILFLTLLLCFILQTTVFQSLKLAGISPNIMLILVVSFGIMRGKMEGMLLGFCAGLLLDVLYGGYIGVFASIYMTIGYFNGNFTQMFYTDDIMLPLWLILLNEFLLNIGIYVVYFLLRNRLDFIFYLRYTILPEMIYTIIITLVLYKPLLGVHLWLKADEKRGN